jgi:hypothetical protein
LGAAADDDDVTQTDKAGSKKGEDAALVRVWKFVSEGSKSDLDSRPIEKMANHIKDGRFLQCPHFPHPHRPYTPAKLGATGDGLSKTVATHSAIGNALAWHRRGVGAVVQHLQAWQMVSLAGEQHSLQAAAVLGNIGNALACTKLEGQYALRFCEKALEIVRTADRGSLDEAVALFNVSRLLLGEKSVKVRNKASRIACKKAPDDVTAAAKHSLGTSSCKECLAMAVLAVAGSEGKLHLQLNVTCLSHRGPYLGAARHGW